MKIIVEGNAFSTVLNKGFETPCIGTITGPIRMIAGIVQAIFNGLACLFSIIPSLCGCIDSKHSYQFLEDCIDGLKHFGRGLIETLPFSSGICGYVQCCEEVDEELPLPADVPYVSDVSDVDDSN